MSDCKYENESMDIQPVHLLFLSYWVFQIV